MDEQIAKLSVVGVGMKTHSGVAATLFQSLAEAGATICVGSWPPALGIFTKLLERGKDTGPS